MSKPYDCIASFEVDGWKVKVHNPIYPNNWLSITIVKPEIGMQKFLKTESEKQKALSGKFTIIPHIHGFEIQ